MIVIAAVVLGAFAPGVRADAPVDLGDNAALRYWRAFGLWWNWNEFWQERDALLAALESSDAIVADELLDHAENIEVVDVLMHAATIEHCDFGIDGGFDAKNLIPSHTRMNAAILLLCVRARVSLDDGDEATAISSLRAAVRMADHISQNGILISAMLSARMMERVHTLVRSADAQDQLSQALRAELLAALAHLPSNDPFRTGQAVAREGELFTEAAIEMLQSDEGRAALREYIKSIWGYQDRNTPRRFRDALDDIRDGEADKLAAQLRSASVDRTAAWNDADRVTAMADWGQEIRDGAYGGLARMIVSDIPEFAALMDEHERNLAAFKELLAE
jgi:hypothetical protein